MRRVHSSWNNAIQRDVLPSIQHLDLIDRQIPDLKIDGEGLRFRAFRRINLDERFEVICTLASQLPNCRHLTFQMDPWMSKNKYIFSELMSSFPRLESIECLIDPQCYELRDVTTQAVMLLDTLIGVLRSLRHTKRITIVNWPVSSLPTSMLESMNTRIKRDVMVSFVHSPCFDFDHFQQTDVQVGAVSYSHIYFLETKSTEPRVSSERMEQSLYDYLQYLTCKLRIPPECIWLAGKASRSVVQALSFAIEHKLTRIMTLLSMQTMLFSYEDFSAACEKDEDSAVQIIQNRIEQGSPVSFARVLPSLPLMKDKDKQLMILDMIESGSFPNDMTAKASEELLFLLVYRLWTSTELCERLYDRYLRPHLSPEKISRLFFQHDVDCICGSAFQFLFKRGAVLLPFIHARQGTSQMSLLSHFLQSRRHQHHVLEPYKLLFCTSIATELLASQPEHLRGALAARPANDAFEVGNALRCVITYIHEGSFASLADCCSIIDGVASVCGGYSQLWIIREQTTGDSFMHMLFQYSMTEAKLSDEEEQFANEPFLPRLIERLVQPLSQEEATAVFSARNDAGMTPLMSFALKHRSTHWDLFRALLQFIKTRTGTEVSWYEPRDAQGRSLLQLSLGFCTYEEDAQRILLPRLFSEATSKSLFVDAFSSEDALKEALQSDPDWEKYLPHSEPIAYTLANSLVVGAREFFEVILLHATVFHSRDLGSLLHLAAKNNSQIIDLFISYGLREDLPIGQRMDVFAKIEGKSPLVALLKAGLRQEASALARVVPECVQKSLFENSPYSLAFQIADYQLAFRFVFPPCYDFPSSRASFLETVLRLAQQCPDYVFPSYEILYKRIQEFELYWKTSCSRAENAAGWLDCASSLRFFEALAKHKHALPFWQCLKRVIEPQGYRALATLKYHLEYRGWEVHLSNKPVIQEIENALSNLAPTKKKSRKTRKARN